MGRAKKFPDEVMARAVRIALEGDRPIAHVAHDFGMHPETLRKKVRQAEADGGTRPELLTSQEREEIRRLRKENYELRRTNEILKSASVFFAKELDPDRPKCPATSTSIAGVSGSSRSAGPWTSQRPPTTNARPDSDRAARWKTSGCLRASARCTRPTTTPTD